MSAVLLKMDILDPHKRQFTEFYVAFLLAVELGEQNVCAQKHNHLLRIADGRERVTHIEITVSINKTIKT